MTDEFSDEYTDPHKVPPAGVTPPSPGAKWIGKWSDHSYHVVPWNCQITPEELSYTATRFAQPGDPGFPFVTTVTETLYVKTRLADNPANGVTCERQDVNSGYGGGTQAIPNSEHGTRYYTACRYPTKPPGDGCGHTLAYSNSHVASDQGTFICSTATPPSKNWILCRATRAWVFVGRYHRDHQTWRYVYCGTTDDEFHLVRGVALKHASYTHAPTAGVATPSAASPKAAGADPEPNTFGKNASDPECWENTLEVDIGLGVSVDEGDPAVLDVSLTRSDGSGSSPCVDVAWGTANGSATSPADYAGVTTSTIQFPTGAMSAGTGTATLQLPSISTVADSVVEGDEQFEVRITGASLCSGTTPPIPTVDRNVATVTIRDTPGNRQVSISPTAVTVTEGDPGDNTVVPVTISHDGSAGDVASVWWQRIDRSAKRSTSSPPDNDYVALPSASGVRLAFPAGATSITADIDIVEDTVCEPTETFEVKIRAPLPTGTTAVAVDTATVTIRDDDCLVPHLSVGPDIAITEGTGGPPTVATVDVSHGGSPGDVASVLYHVVAETATLGTDFTGVGPSGARADIPATATSTSISVDIDPDSLCEPDETFRVEISNLLPTGSAMIDVNEARVRIVDDDCTATSIRVDPDTVQVNEPDPFATLTITHDGSAGDVISVRYRLFDASATAGSDYTTVPSSGIIVNFAGATSVDVDVPIIDDAVCEGAETFTMVIDNPVTRPGVTATVSSPTGRVRILDNEDCVPVILSACDEAQPAGVHSEGTPIGTHPSRGSCPVPYSWSTWPGARTAGRGSPPPRGACVGASAGHDAWNVIAGQTNTLDIFANDRLGGATPSILISPQEGRVSLSGAGAAYVSSAWAHGSDEFIYQLRYGTGSNDFCNARVQITVLDTGPVTLGTGVVFLFPEQGGFEAANWKPSVRTYNDDGADINPHQVQTTHQLWAETQWTCRRRSSVNAGDPDYKGHTIPTGTPHYGGETQFSGPFSRTYHSGNGTTSTSSFTWQETLTGSYDHSHDPLDHHGEGPHGNGIDDHDHSYSYNVTRYSSAVTVSAVQNAPTSRPAAYSDSTTSLTGPYPCPTVAHNGSSVGGSANSIGGCK